MGYIHSKGVGRVQQGQKKSDGMKALRLEDCQLLLTTVEASAPTNPKWRRDYALILISAALGMRRGEVRLFERKHFADLERDGIIHCPTLKQSEKIKFVCAGNMHDGQPCMRQCRVKASSAGTLHECYRCGTKRMVPVPKGKLQSGVILIDIDIVEEFTTAFILNYLNETMRPEQNFLFEASGRWDNLKCDKPISEAHVTQIFNTHLINAGLDPRYSTHCLRHRRGVQLYSQFHDLVAVKTGLRHSSIKTAQFYAGLDEETKQRYRDQLNKPEFNLMSKPKEAKRKK